MKYSLHRNQQAYRKVESTESALHYIVQRAEEVLHNKQVALEFFSM